MTTPTPARHWHIAYGLTGYGPDGSDGFMTAVSPKDLAGQVSDALSESADQAYELLSALASDASEGNAEHLEVTAEFLRYHSLSRAYLPWSARGGQYENDFWADKLDKLDGQVLEGLGAFPMDVSRNSRLYVWECPEGTACEHLEEEI